MHRVFVQNTQHAGLQSPAVQTIHLVSSGSGIITSVKGELYDKQLHFAIVWKNLNQKGA